MKPYRDIDDPRVAKALAHPLRTQILSALEGRTASPSELAAELDAPLGVLSYHMRRLAVLGFVKLVRRVPRRGAVEHYYTATAPPRITNQAWAALPSAVKQATLAAALDQVGAVVTAAAAEGGFDADDAHLSRSPVMVDDEGWHALASELEAMTERIRAIEIESEKRLRRRHKHNGAAKAQRGPSGAERRPATVLLMLFQSPGAAPARPSSAPVVGAASRRGPRTAARNRV
jgi:DNA-binding transcriptional ArsR family regulator